MGGGDVVGLEDLLEVAEGVGCVEEEGGGGNGGGGGREAE